MRFTFKCLAVHHVSGRVTLTPLDFPPLAVHASDLQAAIEELVLAFDDRIGRAHPRWLIDYASGGEGTAASFSLPLLKVRGHTGSDETQSLKVTAVVAPAHRSYQDVRLPRLDLRLWVNGRPGSPEVLAAAQALAREHLEELDEDDLLSLRPEGAEELIDVAVEVSPLRLSDLRRRELELDERPPARPPRLDGADAEEREAEDEEDDWAPEEVLARRRRAALAAKKRPVPTPTLERVGTALHLLAADGAVEAAFERDALVDELRSRLLAEEPEAVVLVGPAGVGKTAIVHEICRRLAAEERKAATGEDGRPSPKQKVFLVDGSRLIAGEGFLGDWQAQVLAVVQESRAAGAILCLGHVAELLDAGKSAYSDQNVSQLLAPVLAAHEIRVVAEATPEEWARLEQRNTSFARLFSAVRVPEPEPPALERLLCRVSADLAARHALASQPGIVSAALDLCRRFMPYGALVGNAVAFLRRLFDGRAHAKAERVTPLDAVTAFSSESGIPERLLRDDLPLDADEVRSFLSARVKGQPAAVERVAAVVSVIKTNLADRRRPSGVLLFAGPTGVGKTELCKAMGELVFGSRDRLVRLDMGEYAGPDALERLIGAPGEPGTLAAAVRRQPFCVVLLDEIEKAHPAVFDALLAVLGEGRLTDAAGRFTDFRSAVVIMTSNIGAESWRPAAGFLDTAGADAMTRHFQTEVRRFFRPELYNRLDDVVVFSPLGEAEIDEIVGRELARVSARDGLRRAEVELVVEDSAARELAARGVDRRYGARPLKRAIERWLVVPVAERLSSRSQQCASRITASAHDGVLELAATSLARAEAPSRAVIRKLLARAADLRAEIRRWSRSEPMQRVRRDVALFTRESQHRAFWSDRTLAEERARSVAGGRELVQAFSGLESLVEAAEDLAYEAHFTRGADSLDSLESDLASLEVERSNVAEQVFASLYPRTGQITLTMVPGRGAWERACWMVDLYSTWAAGRGGKVKTFMAAPKHTGEKRPPSVPATSGGRTRKAATSKPAAGKKPAPAPCRWGAFQPIVLDNRPTPVAACVTVEGPPAVTLLAGEHGVHRFSASGAGAGGTQLVRVCCEPLVRSPSGEFDEEAWSKRMPSAEIRRIWPEKSLVEDLRMGTSYALPDDEAAFELEPVLLDFMAFRVFGRADEGDAP